MVTGGGRKFGYRMAECPQGYGELTSAIPTKVDKTLANIDDSKPCHTPLGVSVLGDHIVP